MNCDPMTRNSVSERCSVFTAKFNNFNTLIFLQTITEK